MKKIIVLGSVSRTLLFPIILVIVMIIYNIIHDELNKSIGTKNIYSIIEFFSQSFGIMSIRFIPCIFKYKSDKSQSSKKSIFKDYFYLTLIVICYMSTSFVFRFAEIGINFEILNVTCLNEVLDMILLLILTKIFLDYKYYIHNVISLILFCVFGVIIDAILGHYSNLKLIDSVYFIDGLTRIAFVCYLKYMMEIKFYKYWNIVFVVGLVSAILDIIIFPCLIKFKVIDNFEVDTKYIVLTLFLSLIFSGFIQFLLIITMINVLTPNHLIIPFEIAKVISIIANKIQNGNNTVTDFLFLIPFVFQILSLLFYLEILEYNFCNLNENTKRNIELREKQSRLIKVDTYASFVEVGQGLIITELSTQPTNEKETYSDSIVL